MMETQNTALRPILKDVRIVPKQCPECHSYYVDNKKCEDCGLDFSKRHILTPDDEKSYYNLMNEYFFEKRRFQIFNILLIPESRFKEFIKLHKKLSWRLKDILNFLENSYRLTKKERFLLVQEARQIIAEKLSCSKLQKSFSKELELFKNTYNGPKTRDCFESVHLVSNSKSFDKKWLLLIVIAFLILGMRSNLLDGPLFSRIFFGL